MFGGLIQMKNDKPKEEQKEEIKEEVKGEVQEEKKEESVKTRCPDCPLRAGLKDDSTLCPTCNGTGLI